LVCSRNDPRKNLPLTMEAVVHARGRVEPLLALGDVPAPQVEEWYRIAEIFVTTSHSEGFNLTLLQGMAAGCACIASDIPAHRELLEDGKEGLLFDSPESMKLKIDAVIADPELRARLGAAARSKSLSYTWRRTAELTAGVYRQVQGSP
ncbi:MAG TPA: glycosyltransferase family 4 protein, partial [Nitrososphaerales archaeon]|nr:glycosyltransferase family 4 protein [Nitrososphaerales archaeon]